jgi:hypothetical protein
MLWSKSKPAAVEEPTLSEAEVMHVDVYLTSQPPEPPAGYDLGEYKKLTSADYDGYRSCLSPTGKAANIFRADIGQWRYLLVQKHPHECCPDCGLDRHRIEELAVRLEKLENKPSVSLMVEHGEFVLRNGESCFYVGKNYRELEEHIEQLGRRIADIDFWVPRWLKDQNERIATAEAGAVELVKRLEENIQAVERVQSISIERIVDAVAEGSREGTDSAIVPVLERIAKLEAEPKAGDVTERQLAKLFELTGELVRRIETVEFDTSERNTFLWKEGITTSTKALDKSREIHARLEAIEKGTAPGVQSSVANCVTDLARLRGELLEEGAHWQKCLDEINTRADRMETIFHAYLAELAALHGKKLEMSEPVEAQPSRPVLVELRKAAKK